MRLANEIAAAAMDHVRGVIRPGMTEAQIAAEWLGFVHGEGTGWGGKVELALGFSLVWAGPGIKTFTATTSRPVVEGEPTLFEIWVCADGYWADHTKNLVVRRAHRGATASSRRGCARSTTTRSRSVRPGASLAELDRRIREGVERIGYPGQPTHPICHGVGARAHEPPYAHQAGGGEVAGRDGSCNRARMLLAGGWRPASRGQLPGHRRRAREAEPVPRRHRPGVTTRVESPRGRVGVTLDRSKVWTGSINEQALEPQPRVTVGLYDTTLRDGEQTIGVVLTPGGQARDRPRARRGRDRPYRGGVPARLRRTTRGRQLIADAGLRAEVWGFSRAVQADVEALVELGVQASVIESPISDGKLEALGVSRETMLERIRTAVAFATENGIRVASSASTPPAPTSSSSTGRTTPRSRRAPRRSWSSTRSASRRRRRPRSSSRGRVDRLDVPVHWHGHDDFGLGTAAAIAAVQAGATWVQGTINGMGERAGNADLVEVALALEALYGIPTRLDLTQARALSRLVAERAGHAAAAVEAGHRRRALHARVGRRRRPVPRPARDRAVLLRARRRGARDRAREEERDRLDPDRARPTRASTCPPSGTPSCSPR